MALLKMRSFDETLASTIKQSTQKRGGGGGGGGKEEQIERGPKYQPKKQNPKWVTRGQGFFGSSQID
jgi:hypothetical protein